MQLFEMMKMIKELGLSIGVFALCAWMVMYIVKNMSKNTEELIANLSMFMNKVKDEHQALTKQHTELERQHERIMQGFDHNNTVHNEMINVLGRINGYKKDNR